MSHLRLNAVDLSPLKDEIIDLVSLCLLKEPKIKPTVAVKFTAGSNVGAEEENVNISGGQESIEHEVESSGDLAVCTHSPSEAEDGTIQRKAEDEKANKTKNVDPDPSEEMIDNLRRLVHYISLHDGEFVLKLALYLRLELFIRGIANFLVALCAREKNCLPYLSSYLAAVVQLPSDWISIANYAYFFDNNRLHKFDEIEQEQLQQKGTAISSSSVKSKVKHTTAKGRRVEESRKNGDDETQRKIPNALRIALVARFASFDEFSLSKYNNEGSERRKRRKSKKQKKDSEQNIQEEYTQKSFTFKQLIHLLRISRPAYLVCCILGKKYPRTKEEFESMGLNEKQPNDKSRLFEESRIGTRMRLAVPETWETRLAKDGNKGAVWDDLFAKNRVPFMATLRNLRNILLRPCSRNTFATVVDRLNSEEEVAESKQFPYRFYTAQQVVKETERYIHFVLQQRQLLSLRGRGRAKGRGQSARGEDKESNIKFLLKSFGNYDFLTSLSFIGPILEALDQAIATAARLNVMPMRGSSIVIFCLSSPLLENIKAVGNAKNAVDSTQTYLQTTGLMIRMLQNASENCKVILYCYDEFKLYEKKCDSEEFLSSVTVFVSTCEQMIRSCESRLSKQVLPQDIYYTRNSGAKFPFAHLDYIIENKFSIEALIVVDVGHHTYSDLNIDAPSLGDLPVYVNRLRRSGNSRMIYAGLSVRAVAKSQQRVADISLDQLSQLGGDEIHLMERLNAKERFSSRDDVLFTGFTESVLRLIAERLSGGAKALVERMGELHKVKRGAFRLGDSSSEETKRALAFIRAREDSWRHKKVLSLPEKAANFPKSPTDRSTMGLSYSEKSRAESERKRSVFEKKKEEIENRIAALEMGEDGFRGDKTPLEESFQYDLAVSEVIHPTPFVALSKKKSRKSLVDNSLQETDSECMRGFFSTERTPVNFLSSYRECRFFISSTFVDMNNERNALVLNVFPRVRRWAAENNLKVNLVEVDLRWGITESSTGENLSTSVCLNEVSRCAPFFIGILGSRYGSCPKPLQVVADEDVEMEDYEWMSDLQPEQETKLSVTELEMRHGIRNAEKRLGESKPKSVIFFERDPEVLDRSLPNDERKDVYKPDSSYALERITNLKQFISANVPIIKYKATFMEEERVSVPVESKEENLEAKMLRVIHFEDKKTESTLKEFKVDDVLLPRQYVSKSVNFEQKKVSTSQDVLLDMTDFSARAFVALRDVIANVCGFSIPFETEEKQESDRRRSTFYGEEETNANNINVEDAAKNSLKSNIQFLVTGMTAMHDYSKALGKIYVHPGDFLNQLAVFALGSDISGSGLSQENKSTNVRLTSPTQVPKSSSFDNAQSWRLNGDAKEMDMLTGMMGDEMVTAGGINSHILCVVGNDGNGKSSALGVLSHHLSKLENVKLCVVFYSVDASHDRSMRSLALYLALVLIEKHNLQDEYRISENDSVDVILQLLPSIYASIKRKRETTIVLLDGLDKSPERGEIVSQLGYIIFPAAEPVVRFVVSVTPNSPVLAALQSRVPPVHQAVIPALNMPERAQLVRNHLSFYGKRLEESFVLNELKDLLTKEDASHPSFLTSAVLYLRLFSCFDTLRDDIRYLPGTTDRLYYQLFNKLEERFEKTTCRFVLMTLYTKQAVGGIKEYNLYRLVSNVGVAKRLVNLLRGAYVNVHNGRVTICSTFFESAIVNKYLQYPSDLRRAFESVLAAELTYQPLTSSHRGMLQQVVLSICKNAKNPEVPCIFDISRYSPSECVSILQSAVLSGRGDVVIALVTYLPFIEVVIKTTKSLQMFVSILSYFQIVSKETDASKVEPILFFIQHFYHILSKRPDLVYQCVQNTSAEIVPISRYSGAQVAYMQKRLTHTRQDGEEAPKYQEEPAYVKEHLRKERTPSPATSTEQFSNVDNKGVNAVQDTKILNSHTLWVKWLNMNQHGGDRQISFYKPSLYEITCTSINHTNTKIAMGCKDFLVRVTSLSTPELIISNLRHAGAVTAVAFLNGKENIIVSACSRSLLYVWSLDDNTLLQLGASHLRPITSLACHPLEPLVLTGGEDSYCMFWELLGSSSTLSSTMLELAREKYGSNANLKQAVSQKMLNKFSVLRTAGKRAALTPFRLERHHSFPVADVAFHRSGEICASGCWGGKLYMFNIRNINIDYVQVEFHGNSNSRNRVKQLVGTENSHTVSIESIGSKKKTERRLPYEYRCFSVDGAIRRVRFVPSLVVTCAVATFSGDIFLFDFASGVQSAHLQHWHNHPLSSMAFSTDSKLVATGDEEGALKISYTGVRGTVLDTLNGHKGTVTSLCFNQGREEVLYSSGKDGSLQLWSMQNKEKAKLPSAHSATVTALTIAPDGSLLVSGSLDGTAHVFKLNESEDDSRTSNFNGAADSSALFIPYFSLDHDNKRVSIIKIALGNTRILVGTVAGTVYVWSSSPGFNLREGRLLNKIQVSVVSYYPIIGVETHDILTPAANVNTESYEMNNEEGLATSFKQRVKSTYVTALTFNGEIVSFFLFDNSVSQALRAATLRSQQSHDTTYQLTSDTNRSQDDEQEESTFIRRCSVYWARPQAVKFGLSFIKANKMTGFSSLASSRVGSPTTSLASAHFDRVEELREADRFLQASMFGEEFIGSLPLYFRIRQDVSPSVTHGTFGQANLSVSAVDNGNITDTDFRLFFSNEERDKSMFLGGTNVSLSRFEYTFDSIWNHFSIVIGRKNVFLLSNKDGTIRPLPVYKSRFKVLNDKEFATELKLGEDEIFTSVSSEACEVRCGDPFHKKIFTLSSNEGNIFILEISFSDESLRACHAKVPEAANIEGTSSEAHSMRDIVLILLSQIYVPIIQGKKDSKSVKIIESEGKNDSRVPASMKLGIQSLDVKFRTTPAGDHLYLFIGCADGSTHVLVKASKLEEDDSCESGNEDDFKELGIFHGSSTITSTTAMISKGATTNSSRKKEAKLREMENFWVVGDILGNVYQLSLETDTLSFSDEFQKNVGNSSNAATLDEKIGKLIGKEGLWKFQKDDLHLMHHFMSAQYNECQSPKFDQNPTLLHLYKDSQNSNELQRTNLVPISDAALHKTSKNGSLFNNAELFTTFDAIRCPKVSTDKNVIDDSEFKLLPKLPEKVNQSVFRFDPSFEDVTLGGDDALDYKHIMQTTVNLPSTQYSMEPVQLSSFASLTKERLKEPVTLSNSDSNVSLEPGKHNKPTVAQTVQHFSRESDDEHQQKISDPRLEKSNTVAFQIDNDRFDQYNKSKYFITNNSPVFENSQPFTGNATSESSEVQFADEKVGSVCGGYFDIINATIPSTLLSAEQKKDWVKKQQNALKEAFRVQGYNQEARQAVEIYNKRIMKGIQLNL